MRPFGSPRQLEMRRRRAIRLLQEGKTLAETAEAVGASRMSVHRWRLAHRRHGDGGLVPKPAPGRPPKLTPSQKERLGRLLLKGPLALGYRTDLWTARRVREVIRSQFGVEYHQNHLWRFLVGLGWSCQKPVKRVKERDEESIVRWKRYRWPHIKKGRKTWCPSRVP